MKKKLLEKTFLSGNRGTILNKKCRSRKNKKADKGRSMLEMLGVLAVIGVLSVGGIVGYRIAMTKYKTNNTLNELNKRALLYLQQLERFGTINDEFQGQSIAGYPVDMIYDGTVNPRLMEITLSGVDKSVCKEILLSSWNLPVDNFIGENRATADNCEQAAVQGLTFAFELELVEKPRDPNICNGHGFVYNGGSCRCDAGWTGYECENPTKPQDDENCHGHGTYSEWGCACDMGWRFNPDCSISDEEACNGHGYSCGWMCSCEPGWMGEQCDKKTTCQTDADCPPKGSYSNFPFCVNSKCTAQCSSDSQCFNKYGTSEPFCIPASLGWNEFPDKITMRCSGGCFSNEQCASVFPSKPYCYRADERWTGNCGTCATGADCKDPTKPFCINASCSAICYSDAQCAISNPLKPYCVKSKCAASK